MKDRSWIEERTWVEETTISTKKIVVITVCLLVLIAASAIAIRKE